MSAVLDAAITSTGIRARVNGLHVLALFLGVMGLFVIVLAVLAWMEASGG